MRGRRSSRPYNDRKVSDESSPNLFLIGFMGVGKSAVGRAVSRKLQMSFIDTDWKIEKEEGKPISEIFASNGEAYFRSLERGLIERGLPRGGAVVSCGGGLPIQPGMPELLQSRGIVVCLFAKSETILARTQGNTRRPLLNVEDPEAKIRELLEKREPVYMKAAIGISADGRTISEVVQNVVRVYHREARLRSPVQGGNEGS